MEQLTILEDAVAGHTLARLRDVATDPPAFRRHAAALGGMLATAALRDMPASTHQVRSPLGPAPASEPAYPVVTVPVLRAGLGLLPGVLEVVPFATVGMIGLERDEDSLEAREYYAKLPPLGGALVLVLEPMLATGGSASDAVGRLGGGRERIVLAAVATETAIERIQSDHRGTRIVTAAVDEGLNEDGFIVPGLGDFGDRLYGTVDA